MAFLYDEVPYYVEFKNVKTFKIFCKKTAKKDKVNLFGFNRDGEIVANFDYSV